MIVYNDLGKYMTKLADLLTLKRRRFWTYRKIRTATLPAIDWKIILWYTDVQNLSNNENFKQLAMEFKKRGSYD